MRTVYPNPKAVVLVLGVLFCLALLVYHHSGNIESPEPDNPTRTKLVGRDINARKRNPPVDDNKFFSADFDDLPQKDGGAVIAKPHQPQLADENNNVDDEVVKDMANELKLDAAEERSENERERKKDEARDKKKPVIPPPPDETKNDHPAQSDEKDKTEDATRREKIVEMARFAWGKYRNLTWGANELKPLAKRPFNQGIFGGPKMMATIVDGADTLWIMGLTKEYNEARDYIRDNFDIKKATSRYSVFEITIRHIGGFLTLYALTGEKFYIDKATDIADSLMVAFETGSGVSKSLIDPLTRTASNYAWAYGGSSILSEVGSLHLEMLYLSKLTRNPVYREKVEKIRNVLEATPKRNGLYPNYLSPETGEFVSDDVSLGAMGDSFYEYLVKEWIHTNRTDEQARRMYRDALDAIRKKYGVSELKNLVFKSAEGWTYVAEMRRGVLSHKMGHLACFSPGMFALEADLEVENSTRRKELMEFAEELGRTCYEFYRMTLTGIGPEMVYFDQDTRGARIQPGESGYVLRPESIEGWFYLWRVTKNKKYKDWVWNAITAIDKYCRAENGYVGLRNVNDLTEGYDDLQQSYFIAETLKYAYLTFTNDVLPFNKWVFSTEAHAFPILDSIK